MYTAFFGLACKPFELVPNPEFLLMSRSHKKALIHLSYGISETAGFILITGEVGTGKTTIIRSMMKGLKENIKLARVNNTRVSSEQLITMINEDFGLDIKGRDKTGMLSDLTAFLIDQYARGKRCVLIIDEAQNLSADLLEEIRLLSNLETDKAKLLQIVLVGQPELMKILARPGLRQLRQRISISCRIQPLLEEETKEYILHRLEVAGNLERQLLLQRGIHVQCTGRQHDRIAVRRRLGDLIRADHAARAGFVLDHERLAERGLQPLADQAAGEIHQPAGRPWDDHADRLVRVLLRLRLRRGRGGECKRGPCECGDSVHVCVSSVLLSALGIEPGFDPDARRMPR